MTLSSLQSTLKDVEGEVEAVEKDLTAKVKEFLLTEDEMEHLEKETEVLNDRCFSISKENNQLQMGIEEEKEKFNTSYREKMEGHRATVPAESQTEAQKELEKKREAIRRILVQRKEELKEDLENPDGNTVQMEKEIEALNEEISVVSSISEGKRERLQQEFELCTQLRKDMESKRFEVIVRRLHLQTSRAQAAHRQRKEEICHLEKQLTELKRQLRSSQDLTVDDH